VSDETIIDEFDNHSLFRDLSTRAVNMLRICLDVYRPGEDRAPEMAEALEAAGYDLSEPITLVAYTGARVAAVLLLHSYAEAASFGIELTHPVDLVARYASLLPEV